MTEPAARAPFAADRQVGCHSSSSYRPDPDLTRSDLTRVDGFSYDLPREGEGSYLAITLVSGRAGRVIGAGVRQGAAGFVPRARPDPHRRLPLAITLGSCPSPGRVV